MTDPVSVPLSRLRVMPKAGSPAILEGIRPGFILHHYTQDVMFVGIMAHPSGGVTYTEPTTVPRSALALDLSAPITARIDGATVAATMLAEAAGLDVSRGVTWETARDDWRSADYAMLKILVGGGQAILCRERTLSDDPRAILAAALVAVLGVAS